MFGGAFAVSMATCVGGKGFVVGNNLILIKGLATDLSRMLHSTGNDKEKTAKASCVACCSLCLFLNTFSWNESSMTEGGGGGERERAGGAENLRMLMSGAWETITG